MAQLQITFFWVVLVCVVFINSCIDPIEFDVPAGLSDSVVIQGHVVKGEESYVEVSISNLFDFTAESRKLVNVESVDLIDDQGNELSLKPVKIGYYRSLLSDSTNIQAEIGTAYKVRVRTLDDRVYESSLDEMLLVANISSLNVSKAAIASNGA